MKWLDLLSSPDDYGSDPVGAAGSQAGHIILAMMLSAVLGPLWALVACMTWEAVQYFRRGARKPDFYQDVAFYALGASAAVPAWWAGLCAVVWGGFYLVRVYR